MVDFGNILFVAAGGALLLAIGAAIMHERSKPDDPTIYTREGIEQRIDEIHEALAASDPNGACDCKICRNLRSELVRLLGILDRWDQSA